MVAIVQSKFAKGQLTPPRPQSAGAVHSVDFYHDVSVSGLLAADILELGVLPAGANICDALLWSDADVSAAVNVTVGIMSGNVGSTDNTRTLGTEIFNASTAITTAHTTLMRMTGVAALKLAATGDHRSIGLQVNTNIVAGANKKLHLRLFYVQGEQ